MRCHVVLLGSFGKWEGEGSKQKERNSSTSDETASVMERSMDTRDWVRRGAPRPDRG